MQIAVIGEGMLELGRQGDGWRLRYGGDTLNSAVHLARFGHDVAFLSALGTDPFSEGLRHDWASEGLDVRHVLADPARSPGLYAISTDPAGERSFTYWRSDSAARGMFALPGIAVALDMAAKADLLLFSLITLAILPESARDRLALLCNDVRSHGGRVALDGNYRPLLWSDPAEAQRALERFVRLSDIGLPTLADEILLHGACTPTEVVARWARADTGAVIVKLGADGCLYSDALETLLVPVDTLADPVDTSGAGDAFNAGYIDAILSGSTPYEAARAGHRLAHWVIGRPGAVPPRDQAAPYR